MVVKREEAGRLSKSFIIEVRNYGSVWIGKMHKEREWSMMLPSFEASKTDDQE